MNPILERLDFWNRLEAVVERLTGATHRTDTAVRGQGPGPDWLAEFRPTPAANVIAFSSPSTPTPSTVSTNACHCATCHLRQGGTCARHTLQPDSVRRAA